jgi:hypothetical protein
VGGGIELKGDEKIQEAGRLIIPGDYPNPVKERFPPI